MKKILIPAVACVALAASCSKDATSTTETSQTVAVQISAKSLSDASTRSEASAEEMKISSVNLFAVDANGYVVKAYPTIENPASTVTLVVDNAASQIVAIANSSEGFCPDIANVATLAEIKALTFDASSEVVAPYGMFGNGSISGSAVEVELIRSVAKIEVVGDNGFEVNTVTVKNTPSMGYVAAQSLVEVPSEAEYVSYEKGDDAIAYVAESTSENPVEILVEGTINGTDAYYTVNVENNGEALDIERNTCYQLTIAPITSTECSVSVVIPEWDDVEADNVNIPTFDTYYAADFHQHSRFSDGSNPIRFVLNQAQHFGIDMIINSEHGGAFNGNGSEGDQEHEYCPTWIESGLNPNEIYGDVNGSGEGQKMWRWQCLRDFSYPQIQKFNADSENHALAIQGLEWNPPGHEHCSIGIITGQFDAENPNASAVAQFEYMFDNNDKDMTGGANEGWVKSTAEGHAKSMEAAAWMQKNHRFTSWMVPAHPERKNLWLIDGYRDLNDVAPDVFFGFESIPGHQASKGRGGYGNTASYGKTYTYGGSGLQSAKIGGLWDAMISEGRRFWLFSNSDFHNHAKFGSSDFYPGEYQKTYIGMKNKDAQSLVDGMRSGNIFCVFGDLITRLEFSVGSATMGQTFETEAGKVATVRILVEDPEGANFNTYSDYTHPALDHIDLIAGDMRERVAKNSPEYTVDSYDNVKVIARFDAVGNVIDGNGIVSEKWTDLGNGKKLVEYGVKIEKDTYFRLRGTNNALNAEGQTDENGNPLVDMPTASSEEAMASAFSDLWFYSNPVFVRAR